MESEFRIVNSNTNTEYQMKKKQVYFISLITPRFIFYDPYIKILLLQKSDNKI